MHKRQQGIKLRFELPGFEPGHQPRHTETHGVVQLRGQCQGCVAAVSALADHKVSTLNASTRIGNMKRSKLPVVGMITLSCRPLPARLDVEPVHTIKLALEMPASL